MTAITIALSKGRIFDETLPLLAAAGIVPAENPETSRKLIIETNQPHVRVVIVRATDVPTYVQYGAADIGADGAAGTCLAGLDGIAAGAVGQGATGGTLDGRTPSGLHRLPHPHQAPGARPVLTLLARAATAAGHHTSTKAR